MPSDIFARSKQATPASWELLTSFTAEDRVPVTKWRSKRTGLSVVLASAPGPLVNGFFALATEDHSDDGLPHTLEHIVFLGSELYPYKGVLDSVANRCLARGTNAWTDTDHTAYTLETAGAQGFLSLLPVYLDHILYPTMTDSGVLTEVHHVNGEGANAGVVYCEMQARENTGPSRAFRAALHALWPGDCGYKYETGGICANLRELTAQKIKDYHRSYYRPDNLCLVLVGTVDPAELFAALLPFEERVAGKGPLPPIPRPWSQNPVLPLTAPVDVLGEFPADDDSVGALYFAWRGPAYAAFEERMAVEVLWEYLTDSAVSPLRKALTELEEPLASEVDYGTLVHSPTATYVVAEGVPVEKMEDCRKVFFETLRGVREAGLDAARLAAVLHRRRLKRLATLEETPWRALTFRIVNDFLYGPEAGSDLAEASSELGRLDALAKKEPGYWTALLDKWVLNAPVVSVSSKPSKALAERMSAEEKARVEAQAKALGEAKLAELKAALEAATAANEVEIPTSLLASFPVPDVSRVPLFEVSTVRSEAPGRPSPTSGPTRGPSPPASPCAPPRPAPPPRRPARRDAAAGRAGAAGGGRRGALPVWTQFDQVESEFAVVEVLLDTTALPARLRPFLQLYGEALFKAGVVRDGRPVDHERVVSELNEDTLSTSASIGISGGTFSPGAFPQAVEVRVKVEKGKYGRAVRWLRELLFQPLFPPDRLKVAAQKLLSEAQQRRREGYAVVHGALREALVGWGPAGARPEGPLSNHGAASLVRQARFLQEFVKLVDSDPHAAWADFEEFRAALVRPDTMRVHVSANAFTLENPKRPWTRDFLPPGVRPAAGRPAALPWTRDFLRALAPAPAPRPGLLVALGAVESSFVAQAAAGPAGFDDPDLPALLVLLEYLTTMEGPLWKQIRGQGLSYSYGIRPEVEEGTIYFTLFKSGSPEKAYPLAAKIARDFASGATEFEAERAAAARASVCYGIIAREQTLEKAAQQRLLHHLRRVGLSYHASLLRSVQAVTPAALKDVCARRVAPLFEARASLAAVVCNPGKVADIAPGEAKEAPRDSAAMGRPLHPLELDALDSFAF
eukprot:tig00000630_g2692.t1